MKFENSNINCYIFGSIALNFEHQVGSSLQCDVQKEVFKLHIIILDSISNAKRRLFSSFFV